MLQLHHSITFPLHRFLTDCRAKEVNQLENNIFDGLPLLLAVPEPLRYWASAVPQPIVSPLPVNCRCAD